MAEKGINFLYLNARSLYKHLDEIFVHYMGYDILCFGETWLHEKIPDNNISIEGYNIFRQDRKISHNISKRGGGGSCNLYLQ